ARAWSEGRSEHVAIGGLTCGPFAGDLRFTVWPGTRLVRVEAVVKTDEDRRAFLYDAGLVSGGPLAPRVAWMDTEGVLPKEDVEAGATDRPLAVRHRTILAESDAGSVAFFPPSHQFFFPRDLTDNLQYAWFGRDHRGLESRTGLGVRQAEKGGGNYVPW